MLVTPKEITVVSGKGGAGKTSITASFCALANNIVICDNDVNAADLHIVLQPKVEKTSTYIGSKLAAINPEECISCGECMKYCHFEAIHFDQEQGYYVNQIQCEGCLLCGRVCRVGAIDYSASENNFWYSSTTRFGKMIHARLAPGEDNSGKLVTLIRTHSAKIASQDGAHYIINDGPPGIGCTAISSITGTDLIVLVIEASLTGWHDAKRLVELASSFNIPMLSIINKHDLNEPLTNEIEKKLAELQIPIIGKIPFSEEFVDAMIERKTIVEHAPNAPVSHILKTCWAKIETALQ